MSIVFPEPIELPDLRSESEKDFDATGPTGKAIASFEYNGLGVYTLPEGLIEQIGVFADTDTVIEVAGSSIVIREGKTVVLSGLQAATVTVQSGQGVVLLARGIDIRV